MPWEVPPWHAHPQCHGQLHCQQYLIADMKSTCPTLVLTWVLSMWKLCWWGTHITQKRPAACTPPSTIEQWTCIHCSQFMDWTLLCANTKHTCQSFFAIWKANKCKGSHDCSRSCLSIHSNLLRSNKPFWVSSILHLILCHSCQGSRSHRGGWDDSADGTW